jgi:ribosomal protein S18 acetylase RimI-like enzyme
VQAAADELLGFVMVRFTLEEGRAAVYVYELQVEPSAQRLGLGRHLMQLVELIGFKWRFDLVMLTVLKINTTAMSFYTRKMKFVVDA